MMTLIWHFDRMPNSLFLRKSHAINSMSQLSTEKQDSGLSNRGTMTMSDDQKTINYVVL